MYTLYIHIFVLCITVFYETATGAGVYYNSLTKHIHIAQNDTNLMSQLTLSQTSSLM